MMTNEMTREQIAYLAMNLYEEGWRASDREELKKGYDLTGWEADVMVEELEKRASQYVQSDLRSGESE